MHGTWLGRGMAQLSAVLDPGMFVLGGGVSAAGEPAWHAFLQHLTAAYKYPRSIGFLDEIPKTPSGKTLRRELRDMESAEDLSSTVQ